VAYSKRAEIEDARINEAPRSKLRGILRNSLKPLPSFAKATEDSPRLHPRSKLRGIRRKRINNSTHICGATGIVGAETPSLKEGAHEDQTS
jgi:hypothetical protein